MRAMILAAGIGQRMGALTQKTPKPLLNVGGRYLIEYAIESLTKAGIDEIVINVSHLKEQIIDALGNGERYGISIFYSEESERLETGGGIVKALPLLGSDPFVVLSADIITDYPIARLFQLPLQLAHLVLIKNPPYNPQGDFYLNDHHEISKGPSNPFTFANIGIYRPELFAGHPPVHRRLAHLWQDALLQGKLTGECYDGLWYNVGTPEALEVANKAI